MTPFFQCIEHPLGPAKGAVDGHHHGQGLRRIVGGQPMYAVGVPEPVNAHIHFGFIDGRLPVRPG
jgi:hypothetical protein